MKNWKGLLLETTTWSHTSRRMSLLFRICSSQLQIAWKCEVLYTFQVSYPPTKPTCEKSDILGYWRCFTILYWLMWARVSLRYLSLTTIYIDLLIILACLSKLHVGNSVINLSTVTKFICWGELFLPSLITTTMWKEHIVKVSLMRSSTTDFGEEGLRAGMLCQWKRRKTMPMFLRYLCYYLILGASGPACAFHCR